MKASKWFLSDVITDDSPDEITFVLDNDQMNVEITLQTHTGEPVRVTSTLNNGDVMADWKGGE